MQYTSHTEAVAEFDHPKSGDVVVATTDDNWAHATRLLIRWDLADLVHTSRWDAARSLSRPRANFVTWTPDADSDLLEINNHEFFHAIGAPVQSLAPDDSTVLASLWAADVEAGEIFPLADSPPGDLQEHIPGRDGAVVSVAGYRGADKVWRFETSTDGGHAWRRTDVQLPLGRQRILPDAYASPHAVGPGRLQALAMTDWVPDAPLYLRELWRTHDEKKFRRVPLPQDRMPFAGMAFASDGALLLAEVDDAMCSISSPVCNRRGKIWRLSPEGSGIKLLSGALPFWT